MLGPPGAMTGRMVATIGDRPAFIHSVAVPWPVRR